jgi:hypothetical protein
MKVTTWLKLIAWLYVAALAMPALVTGPHEPDFRGFHCLIVIPWACAFPAWWANPLLLIGCRMLAGDEPRWAEAFGVVATLLAASHAYTAGLGGVRPGYWLWLGCMVALVAAGIEQGRGTVGVAETMAWDD